MAATWLHLGGAISALLAGLGLLLGDPAASPTAAWPAWSDAHGTQNAGPGSVRLEPRWKRTAEDRSKHLLAVIPSELRHWEFVRRRFPADWPRYSYTRHLCFFLEYSGEQAPRSAPPDPEPEGQILYMTYEVPDPPHGDPPFDPGIAPSRGVPVGQFAEHLHQRLCRRMGLEKPRMTGPTCAGYWRKGWVSQSQGWSTRRNAWFALRTVARKLDGQVHVLHICLRLTGETQVISPEEWDRLIRIFHLGV